MEKTINNHFIYQLVIKCRKIYKEYEAYLGRWLKGKAVLSWGGAGLSTN